MALLLVNGKDRRLGLGSGGAEPIIVCARVDFKQRGCQLRDRLSPLVWSLLQGREA